MNQSENLSAITTLFFVGNFMLYHLKKFPLKKISIINLDYLDYQIESY